MQNPILAAPTFAGMNKHYTFKASGEAGKPFIRVIEDSTYIGDIFNLEGKLNHNLPSLEPIRFFNRQFMGSSSSELTLDLWTTMMNNQR